MKQFFIFLLLATAFSVQSQRNLSVSCIELIELSLDKSYTLKNARNDLSIDSLETKTIKQNYIPTLTMNGAYAYGGGKFNVDIPTFDLPISGISLFDGESEFDAKGHWFNTNLTAKALIFSGMQVTYGAKANNEKIKAKNYLMEGESAEIIKDVIDTFDKIELLEKSKNVLSESEKRLSKEKLKVKIAIQSGLATPFEREKISAAELNIASKKMELEGNLQLLYLKLGMLTGKEPQTFIKYDFEMKPWIISSQNQTYKDRPELQALRASIEAYNYKLKMNRNAVLPKVEAFATLAYFSLFNSSIQTPYETPITEQPIDLDLNHFTGFPTYLLGIGFEWEIFNGLKNSNETQRTRIEKSMAENRKTDAEEKLKLFEQKVMIDFEVKNQQILFKEREKEVASYALDLAIKSYREGLINITERLQAELAFQEASLSYIKAIAMQRQAALELLSASGSLTLNNLNN